MIILKYQFLIYIQKDLTSKSSQRINSLYYVDKSEGRDMEWKATPIYQTLPSMSPLHEMEVTWRIKILKFPSKKFDLIYSERETERERTKKVRSA